MSPHTLWTQARYLQIGLTKIIVERPLGAYLILAMMNRQRKKSPVGLGRRVIVWIAALSLCLNTLLPTAVLALAADGGQSVVICTSDGYQTVRLDGDGAPPPAHHDQKGTCCTVCFGCGGPMAPNNAAATAAPLPATSSAIRPETAPRFWSSDRRRSEPRGPPHLA